MNQQKTRNHFYIVIHYLFIYSITRSICYFFSSVCVCLCGFFFNFVKEQPIDSIAVNFKILSLKISLTDNKSTMLRNKSSVHLTKISYSLPSYCQIASKSLIIRLLDIHLYVFLFHFNVI